MAVTARTLALQADLDAALRSITDRHTRDLVAAWVTAWDEVAPDLTATLLDMLTAGDRVTRSQLLRSTRLRRSLAVIADHLETLAGQANVVITGDLRGVIDTAGWAQASVIDSQLPPVGAHLAALDSWSRVDERQIAAIVERSTQQITSRTRLLSDEAYQVVRRELIRGVAAGTNPRETARRMIQRAERGFNGGLNRALVISRTETLDAYRNAARLGQEQHADVLQGWTWAAKLDTRTCPSCWAQHGSVHALDEGGPDDHQQGRCARLPLTKSWAELGFDIEEPPSLLADSRTTFEALPEADQRAVLGPRRHDAWARGEFPMESWSVKKTTPGWRDSYVVGPAPSPSGGRRSRSAA